MGKSKFVLTGSIIGISLVILWLVFVLPRIPSDSCLQKEKAARNLRIANGVLIKKFNDAPNHNYETIKYKDGEDEKESTDFVFDESGCYQYLQIGDSIFKKSESLLFRVRRNKKDSLFILNYGCKKFD